VAMYVNVYATVQGEMRRLAFPNKAP
jgi:hypothetical protein